MDGKLLSALNAARDTREAVAVVTGLSSGAKRLVTQANVAADGFAEEILSRFKSAKSGIVAGVGEEAFIQVYVPPPRLVIIGAVHISQALAPMATACGFDVTVVDPRTSFATPERFTNINLLPEWPQDIIEDVKLDPYTALAAVTHDPKIDDIPLQAALEAECFYVGALGSRKTNNKRRERLLSAGVKPEAFDSICAPIGLSIGAASPAEIAVAVLAQIVGRLRKGDVA